MRQKWYRLPESEPVLEISQWPSGLNPTKKDVSPTVSFGLKSRSSRRRCRSQTRIPASFQPPTASQRPSGLTAIEVMRRFSPLSRAAARLQAGWGWLESTSKTRAWELSISARVR